MICLVSLFTAALVTLQCCHTANAMIDSKNNLDNNIQPKVPRRRVKPYVNIRDPPPETARLIAGSQLELPCEVIGMPMPTIQWLKNGEPLADYEENSNEILSSHPFSLAQVTSKLIVTEATTGDQFTCVATAGVKQRVASTTVFTIEGDNDEMMALQALFRRPSKPIITLYYNTVLQNISTPLVLPCRVHSNEETQVYWIFNDLPVYGNSRMRVLPSGDLLIPSMEWEEMGNYTCVAKNMYGKESVFTFVYPLID